MRAYHLTRARVGVPKIFVRHLSRPLVFPCHPFEGLFTFSANDVNNNYDFARKAREIRETFCRKVKGS